MTHKPFFKQEKQNKKTYRLPVLLSAEEQAILSEHYEQHKDKFSSLSDMIRQYIAAGIESTTRATAPTP